MAMEMGTDSSSTTGPSIPRNTFTSSTRTARRSVLPQAHPIRTHASNGSVHLFRQSQWLVDVGELIRLCDLQGDLLRELTLTHGHSFPEDFVRGTVLPQLLRALDFLHSKGIVHSDIKPENLFHSSRGDIKLGDLHYATMKKKVLHFSGMRDSAVVQGPPELPPIPLPAFVSQ